MWLLIIEALIVAGMVVYATRWTLAQRRARREALARERGEGLAPTHDVAAADPPAPPPPSS